MCLMRFLILLELRLKLPFKGKLHRCKLEAIYLGSKFRLQYYLCTADIHNDDEYGCLNFSYVLCRFTSLSCAMLIIYAASTQLFIAVRKRLIDCQCRDCLSLVSSCMWYGRRRVTGIVK